MDEDVLPTLRDAHGLLELVVEYVPEGEGALEEESPTAEPIRRRA